MKKNNSERPPVNCPSQSETCQYRPSHKRLLSTYRIKNCFATALCAVLASMITWRAQAVGWVYTGSLGTARAGHTATLLNNGKVLVVGGSSDGSFGGTLAGTCELFNPSKGTWSTTGALLTSPRVGQTATVLANGQVLVAGGEGPGAVPIGDCELYNPTTGKWSETGSLNSPRWGHTATVLPNGLVLVAGGEGYAYGIGNTPSDLSQYELYDPTSGTWCEPSENQPASNVNDLMWSAHAPGFAAFLLNGQLQVFDGGAGNSKPGQDNTGGCEAYTYSPCGGTWQQTKMMPPNVGLATTTLLPGGQVLFTGDGNSAVYQPSTETWQATAGPMNFNLINYTATLLNNGWVLVAGGETYPPSDQVLNNVEIWPGAGGSWTETGPLQTARFSHTATLLQDGRVLVVGGLDDNFNPLASCELYTVPAGDQIMTPLYTFTGGSDGANPMSTLLSVGALFGTTYGSCSSFGTVFKVNSDGSGFTTMHTFAGNLTDGAFPMAGLTVSPTAIGGWLFGTTSSGGANNRGMVYAINIHDDGSDQFNGIPTYVPICSLGSDASYPVSRLTIVPAGPNTWVIYGTAPSGSGQIGPSVFYQGGGAIFYTTVTLDGNGVPSSLLPYPGYKVIYGFTTNKNASAYYRGYAPVGDLTLSGNWLYGTCSAGGYGGFGTVFAAKADGSEIQGLYAWGNSSTQPGGPMAGLLVSGTNIWGTTSGIGNNYGSIFEMQFQTNNVAPFDPIQDSGSIAWCQTLNQGNLGYAWPMGDLCWELQPTSTGGPMLGTFRGPPTGQGHTGGVFEISQDGSHFAMYPLDADGDTGWNPVAGLCAGLGSAQGTFYGTALSGSGASQCTGGPGTGAVFAWHVLDALRTLVVAPNHHFPQLQWLDPPNVVLQSAPSVIGPWTTIVGATPPYTVSNTIPQQYFRLAAIGTNLPVAAPAVSTLPASEVSPTNAILDGEVTPNGANATAWFQYGTNTSYGHLLALGAETNIVFVSQAIGGLIAGLTYHYQLVASNSAGVASGPDATFIAATPATVYVGNDITDPSITGGAADTGAPLVILGEYGPDDFPLASASPSTTMTAGSVQDVQFYGASYNFTLYDLSFLLNGPEAGEQTFQVVASQTFSNTVATAGVQVLAVTNFFVNSGDLLAFAGNGPFYPQTANDQTNSDATYQDSSGLNQGTATPPPGPGFVFNVGPFNDPDATYCYIPDYSYNQGRTYGIGVDIAPTWP